MAIYRLGDRTPEIPDDAWVAAEATLIGSVKLGSRASVWPGAVIRGDNALISIGHSSNVQEGAVLHTDPGLPMLIADHVTIGHQAMLHGCTVGEGSLIGIQAVVLNGAVIGRDCLVGAGAVVTEGKTFPDRSLIIGAPAKAVRELTEEQLAGLKRSAAGYAERSARFKTDLVRLDTPPSA